MGFAPPPPEARKIFNNFIKKLNYKIVKFKKFSDILRKIFANLFKKRITRIFYCGRGFGRGRSPQALAAFHDISLNFLPCPLILSQV